MKKHVTIKNASDISLLIEHTLLRPEATTCDIKRLCCEAIQYKFHGVCVPPVYVEEANRNLKDTDCAVVTVVGFPFGTNLTVTKVEEARQVKLCGATEIDMVMRIGALKEGNYHAVYDDIRSVVEVDTSVPVKVIIENGLLDRAEKIAACLLAVKAGAAFVKTSTGFQTTGATAEDVALMRAVVGDRIQIKAAGGIRNFRMAYALINAGANRLGCSSSLSIVTEK
ncbi:MAG: deoxyribose-phosphate aldolase [Candidatus Kuenenia sp.]|nr:deoxyribose-phosphate aldolase [Candidatus Kuenenia hertensis]